MLTHHNVCRLSFDKAEIRCRTLVRPMRHNHEPVELAAQDRQPIQTLNRRPCRNQLNNFDTAVVLRLNRALATCSCTLLGSEFPYRK